MAVRPIDANAMLNELRPVSFEAEHSAVLLSDVSKMMREWVERQPTLTPPNEPLTLDELREMDGEPVWVEEVEHWALIDIEKSGQWAGIPFAVWAENGANFTYNIEGRELHCFRRPPEGEEGDADRG